MGLKEYREQWFRYARRRWPWANESWLLKAWQRHCRAKRREEDEKNRIQGRLFIEGRS